jgi:hypothetical protein
LETYGGKGEEIWKELQVGQGKMELLTLQTVNDWENMATKNKTKIALYDELVEQLPIAMDELF